MNYEEADVIMGSSLQFNSVTEETDFSEESEIEYIDLSPEELLDWNWKRHKNGDGYIHPAKLNLVSMALNKKYPWMQTLQDYYDHLNYLSRKVDIELFTQKLENLKQEEKSYWACVDEIEKIKNETRLMEIKRRNIAPLYKGSTGGYLSTKKVGGLNAEEKRKLMGEAINYSDSVINTSSEPHVVSKENFIALKVQESVMPALIRPELPKNVGIISKKPYNESYGKPYNESYGRLMGSNSNNSLVGEKRQQQSYRPKNAYVSNHQSKYSQRLL